MLDIDALREEFDYDPDRGVFVDRHARGGPWKKGRIVGRTSPKGYVIVTVLKRNYSASRLAWFYVYGEWPAGEVDHINGVRDDNRIANLRIATRSQNCANKKGVTGVTWHKKHRKWHARVKRHGKMHYLGCFANYDEAVQARNEAHARMFGEFSPVSGV